MSQGLYLTESFSAKGRSFYLVFSAGYWGLSAAFLSIPAYFLRNWIYLEFFLSISCFVFIPFLIWWLPETIPWLYANGRLKEAEAVLQRIAKWNRINLTEQNLEIFSKKQNSFNSVSKPLFASKVETSSLLKNQSLADETKYSILMLIHHHALRKHMSLGLIMFINNFCLYGVTYMSGSLSTNRFISGFFNCVIEMPGCVLAYLICRKYGRKFPVILFQFLATVPMFLCVFTTTYADEIFKTSNSESVMKNLTIILSVFFKFCTAACYAITYFVGSELFPTNIRAQAVAICAMVGKFGGILATYTSLILEHCPNTLYISLGLLMFLGGLLTFNLPETKNKPIPTTIEDIESWYDEKNSKSSQKN